MSHLPRLLQLYADVDEATAAFLRRQPSARCDTGCADCCTRKPPLVSRTEALALEQVLAQQPLDVVARARQRARALAAAMAQGAPADFPCPLLEEDASGTPRCVAYQGRPYACRTFGHTARIPDGAAGPVPFTCERLRPRVALAQPPPVPFRSAALREQVGVPVLEDSYVPIWVGLTAQEQQVRPSGPASAVVVGRPEG